MPSARPNQTPRTTKGGEYDLEAELLRGLAPFAARELRRHSVTVEPGLDPETLRFAYRGALGDLAGLRSVVALYLVEHYEVPRPKALLGHAHVTKLVAQIDTALQQATFRGFRLSAAGRDSSVYARLSAALETATGLVHDPDEGELLLRVRPAASGWEVLARLTPRPLSARGWRVCNRTGGLNATVAWAMLELAGLADGERFLNAMCGSGTLLLEAVLGHRLGRAVGCDLDPEAVACAAQNMRAAAALGPELLTADATALPFEDGGFDLIAADLPWGDRVGTHTENAQLYPSFLHEAARLLVVGGRLVLLTHELRLLERVLQDSSGWHIENTVQVYHGGHHPRMVLLRRSP